MLQPTVRFLKQGRPFYSYSILHCHVVMICWIFVIFFGCYLFYSLVLGTTVVSVFGNCDYFKFRIVRYKCMIPMSRFIAERKSSRVVSIV